MALHELLILALAATLAWAALCDGLWFRIPNAVPLTILALYAAFLLAGGTGLAQLPWAIGLAVATFLVGMFLFSRGWMGGGDVKLLTALALWAGPAHFPTLIVMTSVAGGVLALVGMLMARSGTLSWIALNIRSTLQLAEAPRTPSGRRTIPYGIAIAAGGLHLCGQLWLAAIH